MFACNSAKETKSGLTLTGTLEGLTDGTKVELLSYAAKGMKRDTAIVKEGKFVLKANYADPTPCYFQVESLRAFMQMYVENGEMTMTGNIKDLANVQITGCKAQEEFGIYNKQKAVIDAKYKDVMAELYKPGVTKERAAELSKKLEVQQEEVAALNDKFIKEYPASAHAASLVARMVSGKSAKETEKMIKGMAPEIQKNPMIVKLMAEAAKKAELEVGIDEMLADVNNVPYKVDEKFDGKNLKGIAYLGLMSNNNVCALKKDGTVEVISPKGKVLTTFKPELNGQPTSLAVDNNDDIYVMCGIMEKVVKKVRGRSIERMMPKSVECAVFNATGEKKTTYACEGIVTATGARVVENNLVIADVRGAKLAMFDKANGKVGPVMDGMRPCCGILDFSVNAKKEILVANLGAFRVQGFDFSGKSILAFGQRGKEMNDFHGCCNPVSVANLSTGAIVTVEKDPTRIKIYGKDGAKMIAGIEELVKGCSYIPMIVDANDNLYLASGDKGMVKCVAVN
jgi:hypothetical protein